MASVTKKTISGHVYWYLRECRRVGGVPKIVWQKYLGTAEDIRRTYEAVEHPPKPRAVANTQFGAVAALARLADEIGVAALVDRHVPKRHQGLNPGEYLVLAAINRAVCPKSKAALAEWYATTSLRRFIPATAPLLASQRFWDHFDRLDEATLAAIELDISRAIVARFAVDLSALVYDGSNFFTYIDSRTESELAQRGHNKQKRTDLRQVALGLLVSTDFHLPLLHVVYPGNVTDTTEFKSLTSLLVERYRQLAGSCEGITLIFDKGNNSQEAFETLDASPYHFVGSLVPSQHDDLLDVPLSRFRWLAEPRLDGVRAYRTRKTVFGAERTVLVTHNEALLAGQLRGLGQHLAKARVELRVLQGRLARRAAGLVTQGRTPTRESVEAQVRKILSAQFLAELVRVEIGTSAGVPTLSWHTDDEALARLARRLFGKTLLFTDREDWTDEQIVLAYRAQSKIEDVFKLMKHPHFLRWQPQWHWTDSKIRVHAFTCVLAVTLCSLLQRTLAHRGLPLSIPRMLEELCGIAETTFLHPGPTARTTVVQHVIADRTPMQERLLSLLDISTEIR